ncbi:HAD family hydrolase [Eubacterium aggregans]|uniref:HAD family hydrolase n=1 Tax=Eubacterium aggregans TaxID=81409 RepID=UPI003F2B20AD
MAKPDIRTFRMVEERLGIDGGQSVFIGDAYHNDVLGAKNAGWQSIWVNRRRNPLQKDVAASPDFIIQDEDELMAVVAHLIQELDS